MAFFSTLPAEKQNSLYEQIEAKVSAESEAMYQTALRKATSAKQRANCAGQYKGRWFDLLEAWMADKVSNLFVRDCLSQGFVSDFSV